MIVSEVWDMDNKLPRNCSECRFYEWPSRCEYSCRFIFGEHVVGLGSYEANLPDAQKVKDMPGRPDWCELIELVRCKDCKHRPVFGPNRDEHWDDLRFPNDLENPCPARCEDDAYAWMPDDDFFCGYGERREQ